MQRIYTLIISLRLNEIVQHVIQVAKKDVGEKVQKTVKSLVKSIVPLNVLKEDVLVQNPEIVAIYFVQEVARDQHKKTV